MNRKGPNNSLTPGPAILDHLGPSARPTVDTHSPPDLGTIDDFDAFVASTRELGMEVALDLALVAI